MSSERSTLLQFLGDAQDCAAAMLEMAEYVQNELQNVKVDEPTRSKLTTLLPEIAGAGRTLHETVALLYALQLPAGQKLDQRGLIQNALQHTSTLLLSLNEIVGRLSESSNRDPSQSLAFVLVAESAVNILNPFNRASAAAERLLAELS